MAYIGREPVIGNFVKLDAISVVNGQAAYTMNNGGSAFTNYDNVNQFLVSLNGILQAPTDSFTVSGSTLTFASNLATGDVIDFVIVLGNTLDIGTPSDNTVSLAKLTATGTKDATTFLRGDNTFASAQGKFESQLLHVRQEVNSGTDSQTLSNAGANTRVLDTVKTNEITGASLSSNEITLPAGTYFCLASAPAYLTSNHQAILFNTTDSSTTLVGTTEHAWNNGYTTTHSFVRGRFTISGTKGFTLRHYVGQTRNTSGGGTGFGNGFVDVYAEVMIWKVA